MTSTSSSMAPTRRNPAVVTIDIIVSVLLLILCAGIALGVLVTALSYLQLPTSNPTVLSIVCYGLMVVAVLGAFIAFGMVIVNLIRKRAAFWWPLGGAILIIGLFYLGTWILSFSVTA